MSEMYEYNSPNAQIRPLRICKNKSSSIWFFSSPQTWCTVHLHANVTRSSLAKWIVLRLSYWAFYGKVETEWSLWMGCHQVPPFPLQKSPCKRTSFCSWKNGEGFFYCKAASLLYCSSWVMKVQRGNPKCVWVTLKQTGWQIAFRPAFTLFPLFLFIAMVNPPAPLL